MRRRLHEQRLTGEPFATPAEAVAWSGAVQAQEYAEALWSLGMRVRDGRASDIEAACDRGELLRTHVLRPTWHFVAAADLRWLLRLTGPRVQAKSAGRYRELGLDESTLTRAGETLAATLADGAPRIRRELAAALEAAGIDSSGQRIAHIVMHAELEGIVASGPRRGKQHTYLPLDGRVPPAPPRGREDDVAALVVRYFVSHGPATLRDFAWWSGLTTADAKAGIAATGDRLTSVPCADGTLWIASAQPAAGTPPRSSGAFLLGHVRRGGRRLPRPAQRARPGRPDSTLLARPIVIDGRTVGRWTRRLGRREVKVHAALDVTPSARQLAALRAAADRFGTFIGLPARLVVGT